MQVDIDYDQDFNLITIGLEYKTNLISMIMSLSFDKGNKQFNELYTSLHNNIYYSFLKGDSMINTNVNNEVEFFSGDLYVKISKSLIIDAFTKIYIINNK